MVQLDVSTYVSQVPELDRFPTIDQLNDFAHRIVREFPLKSRLRQIGESRGGDPLFLLSMGSGAKQNLVVAGAHSTEPIGFLTLMQLARMVAQFPELSEKLDYTWNFFLCLDPDSARMNEAWYVGPITLR